MLERYLGRKESPKISIESDPALEGSKKPLWENALKDPEFMKWFSGSVVSDSSGNPIPVFHGTRGPLTFEEVYKAGPTELGMHFGAIDAANTRLEHTFDSANRSAEPPEKFYEWARDRILKSGRGEEWIQSELLELEREHQEDQAVYQERMTQKVIGGEKVYPVFLRITNPVRVNDPGSFTSDNLNRIRKDLIQNFVTRDQVAKIQSVQTIEELRTALVELGYDGVVYKNGVEGETTDSYIPIVGPEQVRSAFSLSPQEESSQTIHYSEAA